MSPATAIDSLLIDELTAAPRGFKTMVCQEAVAASPITGDALKPGSNVAGTVAFAGRISGLVVFCSSMDAAQVITASMRASSPPESTASCPMRSAS
jgi:CheY-specific phosphatase CheX